MVISVNTCRANVDEILETPARPLTFTSQSVVFEIRASGVCAVLSKNFSKLPLFSESKVRHPVQSEFSIFLHIVELTKIYKFI